MNDKNASPLFVIEPSIAHQTVISHPKCCGKERKASTLPLKQDMLMDSSAADCSLCSAY